MTLLLLSVVILALGPALHELMRSSPRASAALDGMVTVAIAGLVLLHVLPEALSISGSVTIAVIVAGAVMPMALERVGSIATRGVHTMVLLLTIGGLIIHTLLDGVALAASAHDGGSLAMALAVVLHRLPVAIAIWWLVRPRYGIAWAALALALVAASTLTGFVAEAELYDVIGEGAFALVQAFVAGSLLHVLVHHDHDHDHHGDPHHHHHHAATRHPAMETLGAIVGAGMVAAIPWIEQVERAARRSVGALHDHVAHAHHHHHAARETTGYALTQQDYLDRLVHLFLESAPALLLGFALAGLMAAYLPRATTRWMRARTMPGQAARGVMFGLPIPICSCGVIPLYRTLIERGAPPAAALAFLVATPELGIEAIMLSVPLLGAPLTVARLVAAAVVAMGAGSIVAWWLERGRRASGDGAQAHDEQAPKAPTIRGVARAREAARFGFIEVVDDTAAWILAGLAIAALIVPGSLSDVIAAWPAGVDVLLFAALGLPIYVCASGATPLAAALIFAGASPGAAIAFLLAGPASNVTTLGVLATLHNRATAALFAAVVIALAVACGWLTNWSLGSLSIPTHVATEEHDHTSWWRIACAVALALIFILSLCRQGPRAWLGTILTLGEHGHDHDHDHDHGSCCHSNESHEDHHHHHDHHHGHDGHVGHVGHHDHDHDHEPTS